MTAYDDLPLNLYSAQQVRDLDARLIAASTPGLDLMRLTAHADPLVYFTSTFHSLVQK